MSARRVTLRTHHLVCGLPAFFATGCDGADGVVIGASLLSGMLGAALVVRVFTPRHGEERPATMPMSHDARPPTPVQSASVSSRVPVEAAGTELFVSPCPQHRDSPGTWTCRFCKRDHCDKCRTSVGGVPVCPSRACREVAERQRTAAGERRGSIR